jgi:hypothetical protein
VLQISALREADDREVWMDPERGYRRVPREFGRH